MTSLYRIISAAVLLLVIFNAKAQEEPVYTNYINNPLEINPAIAGTVEGLNLNLLTRHQWIGIDGYPASYSFGAHTPYQKQNFGLGISMVTDRVGPVRNTHFKASYAYQITVFQGASLSMGLNAGISNFSAAISGLELNESNDHQFHSDLNRTSPVFGVGFYLKTDDYFAGLSSPRLIHVRLEDEYRQSDERYNPSVYLMGGYNHRLDYQWRFLPSALITVLPGAPVAADITARFMYQDQYYMGAHYRIGDAAGLFFNIQISEFLKAGYAFDFTLNKLSSVNSGSHEFMVAYKLQDLW
ncbi:MAG: type IX secretion system membrane protein PorP/SprF [Bacteroidota bacterium]